MNWRIALAMLMCFCVNSFALASDRMVLNFNPDWKFIKADPAGAQRLDFDDRRWTTVSTPHTYNDVDSFDQMSPGNMKGETDLWSGQTWYRKHFTLPASLAGKQVYIEFDAVRQVAEVYLNGHYLGACKNGFIPFGFDLTPYVKFGQPNVLAVMCDNRYMISDIAPRKAGKDTRKENQSSGEPRTLAEYSKQVNAKIPNDVSKIQANQIPWNNPEWHPPLGGIYRDVRLYVTDPLHISLPLYDFLQTEGPYVYATKISAKSVDVTVEIPIDNGRKTNEQITARAEILDHDGKPVATWDKPIRIDAGAHAGIDLSGSISHPQLWEPDYPYLYTVVCSIRQGDKQIDSCRLPLGIRAVHWDAQTGFWINGHHLKLHGWGQRPTDNWPGLGSAQPDWLHFYTLDLMKQAGANFLRWGHCAGGASMIRAGDELGLITDQPGVDGESDTVGAAWKIRADAFRDCIIYFRNDPSILIWEGGNQKVIEAHAAQLRAITDKYDPHGGRALTFRRADKTTAKFMDIDLGTEGSHEVAAMPVVEGEYDREESPRRIWDDFSPPSFGYRRAKGQTYDLNSEQFAIDEITQYIRKIGAKNHCGGANWIFSDSTSGGRDTTEVDRASGEVDAVRLPKEAYFACKTIFRADPQIHIIGHWTYPAGTRKNIYVVSNCPRVELFVNGKSLGQGARSNQYLFTFPNVRFAPGQIRAIGFENGNPVASEAIQTAGVPVALRLSSITGPDGLLADGSDVALINVEAIDAHGERCPTFQKRVDFTCTGPAVWRGGYNSGIAGTISQTHLNLECGINRVSVGSTLRPGKITVAAHCPGLKSASIIVDSHPFPLHDGCSTILPVMPAAPLPHQHASWDNFTADVPMSVTDATTAARAVGRFTRSFSYTGPAAALVHLETDTADGKNIYCDRDEAFSDLPSQLSGADWVQGAFADRAYTDADLMQLDVNANTIVYIAYDPALDTPAWLSSQFHPTKLRLHIGGREMNIFSLPTDHEQSVTLGSNSGDPGRANMYVVFIQGSAKQ